jgi:alpha-galactosidase
MVDEMLVAQAEWLPQYAHAIPAARARLKKPKVKTKDWNGAARLKVRTVEELRSAKSTPTMMKSSAHLGTSIGG